MQTAKMGPKMLTGIGFRWQYANLSLLFWLTYKEQKLFLKSKKLQYLRKLYTEECNINICEMFVYVRHYAKVFPPIISTFCSSFYNHALQRENVQDHVARVCRVAGPGHHSLDSEPLCNMGPKGWDAWAGAGAPVP